MICESKIDQDILWVQCGKYRGVINVKDDMPDCLRHEKLENGKTKRTFISKIISLNNKEDSKIKLPAIAHIDNSNNNKTYHFSVFDACSKCIEQLEDKELCPGFKETEIIMSWTDTKSNGRHVILRWHDLYTFMHLDETDIQELNYEGDWENGSKLTIWLNGIDQDLSFDAFPYNPRIYWNTSNLKVGDYVFVNKIWLSRMGIYRTKIEGCTGTILPGFTLDEEQIDYNLKPYHRKLC